MSSSWRESQATAGERAPLHTHRWPSIYTILSWRHFLRTDDQGQVLVDGSPG